MIRLKFKISKLKILKYYSRFDQYKINFIRLINNKNILKKKEI